jgi:tRNA pseudouridine55 synthase
MAQVQLSADEATRLRHGQRVKFTSASGGHLTPEVTELALLAESGELVGIGVVERGEIKPQIVFNA